MGRSKLNQDHSKLNLAVARAIPGGVTQLARILIGRTGLADAVKVDPLRTTQRCRVHADVVTIDIDASNVVDPGADRQGPEACLVVKLLAVNRTGLVVIRRIRWNADNISIRVALPGSLARRSGLAAVCM